MYSLPLQEQLSQTLLASACESAPQPQADGAAELPAIKGTGKNSRWTEQQATSVIASWKENLERIGSARNAEAWQRIMDDVNKTGGKKTMKHEL